MVRHRLSLGNIDEKSANTLAILLRMNNLPENIISFDSVIARKYDLLNRGNEFEKVFNQATTAFSASSPEASEAVEELKLFLLLSPKARLQS